jgi:uncharacterized protein YukE
MSQAFVNPERLRAFAQGARGFGEQTGESMGRLEAQIQRLGNTWRDQEYQRFTQEFHKVKAQLAVLRGEIDKLVPVLEADAKAAENIHRG